MRSLFHSLTLTLQVILEWAGAGQPAESIGEFFVRTVQARTPALIEWLTQRRSSDEAEECAADCPEREWAEEESERMKRMAEKRQRGRTEEKRRVCYHSKRLSHAKDLISLMECRNRRHDR